MTEAGHEFRSDGLQDLCFEQLCDTICDFVSFQRILTDPLLEPLILTPLIDCFRAICTLNFTVTVGKRAKEEGHFCANNTRDGRKG